MPEILTLEEIKVKYPSEWVLVADPEMDEHNEVIRGAVVFHGLDREKMYDKAIELPAPKSVAFVYTGTTPKGMVFAL